MQERRAKISFWITVVSFAGSIVFVSKLIFFGTNKSPECKDCIEKILYYQHRADSLENVIQQKNLSK